MADWDYNQFETLLCAWIHATGADVGDWDMRVFESLYEAVYGAWQDTIDWDKFESLCFDARADKEAEQREDGPEYVAISVRCAYTLDLFA
ncbi:hypothetical protein [Burkholderia seminalis]|uniref:hypothetical protein n=1 Tax=Burkholderia seminalis TaxID=488731 RepID=UPI002653858A|nr:hypothetical protein [Burkholderia seminalis]MDN7588389.1 hypothetical protein [Burkholderia seminalis]